jgi:DNA modification methylase
MCLSTARRSKHAVAPPVTLGRVKPRPSHSHRPPREQFKKPPLRLQPTTLWDYPSQDYGDAQQGIPGYKGATPSYIIWNLLQRYTKEGDLVIDPCAGSGTTLDVARDLNRRALGYDVHARRKDIFRVDAKKLPPELTGKVDFVFIDPPYSTHLDYGDDPRDIGKLSAKSGDYYAAMEKVFAEIVRVLKPGKHMGLYVSDSYEHKEGAGTFYALGFELFGRMQQAGLIPVDIVSVVRHNKTLEMGNYRKAAEEGNFYLRGFNYLFIMKKPAGSGT